MHVIAPRMQNSEVYLSCTFLNICYSIPFFTLRNCFPSSSLILLDRVKNANLRAVGYTLALGTRTAGTQMQIVCFGSPTFKAGQRLLGGYVVVIGVYILCVHLCVFVCACLSVSKLDQISIDILKDKLIKFCLKLD